MSKEQKLSINSVPVRLAILIVALVAMLAAGYFLLGGDDDNNESLPIVPADFEPTPFSKLQAEHPGNDDAALEFWTDQLEQSEAGSEFRGDVYVQVVTIHSNRQEHDKVIELVAAAEAEGYEKRAFYTILSFTYQSLDDPENLVKSLRRELELLDPNDPVYEDDKASIEARIDAQFAT